MLIGISAVRLLLLNGRVAGIRGIVGHLAQRIGWIGVACPRPAAASLSVGFPQTVLFVITILTGMALYDRVWSRWS